MQDNLYILAQYCKFLPLSWYTPDFISILLQQLKKFKDNNLKDEKAQITLSSILFLFSHYATLIPSVSRSGALNRVVEYAKGLGEFDDVVAVHLIEFISVILFRGWNKHGVDEFLISICQTRLDSFE